MPNQDTIESTTQKFLDIHDITNDIIILKDGACSVVLTVNAMNFGLLAEEEQDAVIYSYASLLNSINYPIQIVIRSQTKDASSYLALLKEREEESPDREKQELIRRYREFVSNLIRERNVLDKKFYVVIPASSLEMGLTTTQNLMSGFKEVTIKGIEKNVILEKARNLLEPKRDHLIAQFNKIGLLARQLNTQEIIQLFYTSYNPEATEGQQITDSRSYTTPLVQARVRGAIMNNPTPTSPTTPASAGPADASKPVDATAPAANPTPAVDPAAVITPTGSNGKSAEPTPQASAGPSPAPAPSTPSPTVGTPPTPPVGGPSPVGGPAPTPPSPTPPVGGPAPVTPPAPPTAGQASGPVGSQPTPPQPKADQPMAEAGGPAIGSSAQDAINSSVQAIGGAPTPPAPASGPAPMGGAKPADKPADKAKDKPADKPADKPGDEKAKDDPKKDGSSMPPLPEI